MQTNNVNKNCGIFKNEQGKIRKEGHLIWIWRTFKESRNQGIKEPKNQGIKESGCYMILAIQLNGLNNFNWRMSKGFLDDIEFGGLNMMKEWTVL